MNKSFKRLSKLNPYSKLIQLGMNENLDDTQIKKNTHFNIFCIVWYHSFLMNIILTLIKEEPQLNIILINSSGFLFVMICQWLNHIGKFNLAVFSLLTYTIFNFFLLSCFLVNESFVEFFFLIVPCLGLLFFDKNFYSWILMVLSLTAFHASFLLFDNYQDKGLIFSPPLLTFLFVVVFMIVFYLKKLNNQNERLLRLERDKVLNDKIILQQQQKELEELNEFKSHFFVNLSHEIRTPLTLITGHNERIHNVLGDNMNPILNGSTKSIKEQCDKIKTIVDGVIDLSKLDTQSLDMDLKRIALTPFITRIYQSFKVPFENKGVKLKFINHTNELYIDADELYLERAINNILNNALKYTQPTGSVFITLSFNNSQLIIEIRDQGIGIPREQISQVFERFFQVKDNPINKTGGSGIGLSFTKEIIGLHQGSIDVESELNSGSSFFIKLPISVYKTNNSTVSTLHHKPNLKLLDPSLYNLLIVEDNVEMRQLIKGTFKSYRCYEANHGLEALEILMKESIDLVITDFMMPKMDGYQLVMELKKRQINVPVIVLTARTEPQAKLELLNAGINDYIHKPFSMQELSIRVKNILNQNASRQEVIEDENNLLNQEDDTLLKIRLFIEENLNKPLKISDLVNNFYMSQSTLSRLIKSETGLSTNNFIKEVRLRVARKYIETGKYKTLKELSNAVGYNKPDYFSRLYEERFGVKPNENHVDEAITL
ncbi:ATP-binding response regulator [Reichenbachiella versicolor]|uniref:ATP-binding response regulator n=1 Tax=Reichenbachiella versicolor TaxID=1821036 RepID=UPI000D6E6448|nr:response regulator [Reichenbachiella versicolor]